MKFHSSSQNYFKSFCLREHLLMVAFIRFRCFSEHLKVDALFIKRPSYFFLGIILFKESPPPPPPKKKKQTKQNKKKRLHSHFHEEAEFRHCFLPCFYLFFTPSLFKNFHLLTKHKEFDFFKATLSTLNIHIKLIYIKGSFGFTFE